MPPEKQFTPSSSPVEDNEVDVNNNEPTSSTTTVEQATLEALTTTLRGCNAHLGGSAIGKGFRLAARYHLMKRAPHSLPLLRSSSPNISSSSNIKSFSLIDNAADTKMSSPQWDDTVLEPGVQHTIEDPFYIVDLGIVSTQLARWRAAFPRVVPYYAIKCNPDPAIVRTLMSLGCNFDCASR